jgi:phosphoribosyl-ATP pyrophosphohydrolase
VFADDLKNEICDLLYHLLVLMADLDIPLAEVEEILRERAEKTGNLKQMKTVNKDS